MSMVINDTPVLVLMIPIIYPVIVQLGFDPIWFGVIIVMTVELGLITPPVGMNVFVLNSLARDIPIQRVFAGVMPFVLTDVIRLSLLVAFPVLVLFLPNSMQ